MEKNNQDIDICDLNSRFEKIKASDEKINKKNFCHNCQVETFQKKVFEHIDIITPEVIPFNEDGRRGESVWTIGGIIWRITECNGCGKMNFNVYRRNSVLEELVLEHQYPTKGFRPIPAWVTYLKKDYIELILEIYHSLNSGRNRLPLMGARTLLDMLIVDKVGDVGTFQKKLQKLVDEKYISKASQDLLEVALEYGHAAIHRGYKSSTEQINEVLDIIENILESEALIEKSKKLKSDIPKRK